MLVFFFFLSTHPTLPPLLFPNSLLDCHESVSLISSCLLESKTFLYFSKYKSTFGCQRDKLCCASTSVGSGFMSEAYQRRWVREEHWLIMILFASCNYMCRYKSGYKYIIYPAVDQRLENSAGKDDLVCLLVWCHLFASIVSADTKIDIYILCNILYIIY